MDPYSTISGTHPVQHPSQTAAPAPLQANPPQNFPPQYPIAPPQEPVLPPGKIKTLKRDGWMCVVVALLVPLLGAYSVYAGSKLHGEGEVQGIPMMIFGGGILAGRVMLWRMGIWP